MRIRLCTLALAAVLGIAAGSPANAGEAPYLEVVDKVAGEPSRQLDLEAIKGLGVVTFATSTPWTDGRMTFEAVPGDRLLAAIGGDGRVIRAEALDDYTVEIPIEDFRSGKAHLAFSMNGQPLTSDDFGPFWIVYRYDSDPTLVDEAHLARSIWQLKSLGVR